MAAVVAAVATVAAASLHVIVYEREGGVGLRVRPAVLPAMKRPCERRAGEVRDHDGRHASRVRQSFRGGSERAPFKDLI